MGDALQVRLRIGDRGGPAFSPSGAPALSWQVVDAGDGWRQAAYETEVIRDGAEAARGRVDSGESQHRPWPGEPLAAYASAAVRVRLQDGSGAWTGWSAPVTVRTGPLGADDWHAPFVALAAEPADDRGTVRFRRVVQVRAGLRSAVLSLTSHGVHEAVVNGERVDDVVLAPGWTAYERRLLFRSVDVAGMLREGANVLGATVAEGWYRERFGFDGDFAVAYPGPVALAAQLRLEYADGVEEVLTGADWTASASGPTVAASIYQGETHDARREDTALADPGVELPGSTAAVVVEADRSRLQPLTAPPVRRIERMPVREVLTTPSGSTVLDFGQNLVGWLELRLDLPRGTEVVLRHAEVLEQGELGVRPLRFAAATDRWVSAGSAAVWSPRFTFHGFRYAEITGADIDPADVVAVVVHSDLARTGTFACSDPMLERLHENVIWGMRGNFVGIPTDCPQRDERLGWTGDIQVFARTAAYLYDVSGFLGSWLQDLALEQGPDGAVPMVVPSPLPEPPAAAAAWGDAATLVPDALFERYGDPAVLSRQLGSMRAWVEAERERAGDDLLWTGDFQFGDWLDPSAPPHNPAAARTDADLVASAYFAHSARRLAAAAAVLGRDEQAAEYGALADRAREAFRAAFVTPSGRVLSDAHTAYALVIAFDLVDGRQRQAAGDRLAELVRAYGYRIRTGFVGTPLICDALTATGHVDTAYRLLLERGNPSWLYPVTMGATTIWERWDSMLPDGSINPGEMTSFNHYALGAVADWMQRTIGGIAPLEPGYRAVEIAPVPGGGLTSAAAALETGYGAVATEWEVDGRELRLRVTVPVGVTATVRLPGGAEPVRVEHGVHAFSAVLPQEPEQPAIDMGSTLAQLVDDPAARSAVEAYFARVGYFIGLGWTESGRWRSDSVLGSSLLMMPAAARAGLADELARLAAAD